MFGSIRRFISSIEHSLIRAMTPTTIIYPNNEVTVIPAEITDVMSYIRQLYSSLDEQQCNTVKFTYDDLMELKPKGSNSSLISMPEKYNALVGVHPELYWAFFLDTNDFIAFHNDKIIASINNSGANKREFFIAPKFEYIEHPRNFPSIIRGWHRKTLESLISRSTLVFKSIHKDNKFREKRNLNNGYWSDFFNSPLALERFHHKTFELFDKNKHLPNGNVMGTRIVCYPYFLYFKDYFASIIAKRQPISLYDFLNQLDLLNTGYNHNNIGLAEECLRKAYDKANIKPVKFDNKIFELKQRDTFHNINLESEILALSRIYTPSRQTYTLIGYWSYKERTNTLKKEWITLDTYSERIVDVVPYIGQDFEQNNVGIINNVLIKLEKNLESLNSIFDELKNSGDEDDITTDAIIAVRQEITNRNIHLNYLKHFMNEIFTDKIEVI